MDTLQNHTKWMTAAIDLAKKGVGLTSPNPPVGAILIRDDKIISSGWHHGAGSAHAEAVCLKDISPADCIDTTLYITLEPCSSHGRTPPCTDIILEKKITSVVIGAIDPNPIHSHRGIKILTDNNIAVTTGVLEEECEDLIRPFTTYIKKNRPYVIAKSAITLDGRITRPPGEPSDISSTASRADTHDLRRRADAIIIGAETLRRDDPELTCRGEIPVNCEKKQPLRVIISRDASAIQRAKYKLFNDKNADWSIVIDGAGQKISPTEILQKLYKLGCQTILIEGGGKLLGDFFDTQLIDEIHLYLSPRISGGNTPVIGGLGEISARITKPTYQRIDDDIHMSGFLNFEK